MARRFLGSLLAVLLTLSLAAPAAARSIVPPPERRGWPPEIQLRSLRATATVADGVAQVSLDQTFVNTTGGPAEGTYLFPLPAGATLSSFHMFVDGKAYSAEVLKAEEARAVYESIVQRNRDPALLQYVGQGLLQARVFPIPAGEERRIRVEYQQVLPRDGGLRELLIPVGQEAIPHVTISADIKGSGIGQVYSPTHDLGLTRRTDGSVAASFEGQNVRGDFRLLFGEPASQVTANLLTYKTRGEDGYFMLLVNPPDQVAAAEKIAKDVLLVLDLSGSMAGEKFEQAKGAALQILGALEREDRFALIGFHSGTVTYADELRTAAEAEQAMDYVRDLRLGGATNIGEAMERAQQMAGKGDGRPQVIVLITDGQPTAGITEPDRIVEQVRSRATPSQRIFTFGVGFDVNTMLLDTMAQENRGRSDYVKPGENLESAVAAFWRKVGQPVLSDLSIQVTGAKVEEVYPRPLPDLYLGSELVVLGRYREGGRADITIRGKVNGREQTFKFEHRAFEPVSNTTRDYIPRLWASRKVGYLLGEIRKNGQNRELVDEVVALAQRYGLATPYTSFFVNEPTSVPAPAPGAVRMEDLGKSPSKQEAAKRVADAVATAPAAGQTAVQQAESLSTMREAKALSQTEPGGDQVRTVGHKAFQLKQGVWVDTTYTGGDLIHLKLGSEQYLKLAAARPDLARFLAVGTPLVLVDGDRAYGVDLPGHEESELPADATLPAPSSGSGGSKWPLLAGGGLVIGLVVTTLLIRKRFSST